MQNLKTYFKIILFLSVFTLIIFFSIWSNLAVSLIAKSIDPTQIQPEITWLNEKVLLAKGDNKCVPPIKVKKMPQLFEYMFSYQAWTEPSQLTIIVNNLSSLKIKEILINHIGSYCGNKTDNLDSIKQSALSNPESIALAKKNGYCTTSSFTKIAGKDRICSWGSFVSFDKLNSNLETYIDFGYFLEKLDKDPTILKDSLLNDTFLKPTDNAVSMGNSSL